MYQHGRSLVKKFDGKPFVIVGINSDTDRKMVKELMAKEKITWPSFWDKRYGPISTNWNVHSWLNIWVLDGQGVIRHRNVRGRELDDAVDSLLRE